MSAVTAEAAERLEGKIDQMMSLMGIGKQPPMSLNQIEANAMADVIKFRQKRSQKNDSKTSKK